MDDCLIIGGGVVGLSLAYVLAGEGLSVRLLEAADQPGREASWAGAGILPPAASTSLDPVQQLTSLSNHLHAQWATDLREQTGIDNGFRGCGGIYLARDSRLADELQCQAAQWRADGLRLSELSPAELAGREPELQSREPLSACYFLPDECQVRNPRHLKALVAACERRRVTIEVNQRVQEFRATGCKVQEVHTPHERFRAGAVCLTTGCWTGALAEQLGLRLAIKPVRGQIALLATGRRVLTHVVNEGRRYLVPRDDGRVLAGSTEEDAGFDRQPTAEGIQGLLELAASLVPALAKAQFERGWAGLRPSTVDGLPYLGQAPEYANAFIAAGHFRSGLQLSTGTAAAVACLVRGEKPPIDLTAFSPNRL